MRLEAAGFCWNDLCCDRGGNTFLLFPGGAGRAVRAAAVGAGCSFVSCLGCLEGGGVGDEEDVCLCSVLVLRRQADVTLVAVNTLDLRRLAGRPCSRCITPSSWCSLITCTQPKKPF